MSTITTTDELREAFLQYYVSRDHLRVPSGSLVPHHALAPLFTNAGMVPFLPVFLGEAEAPHPRATSSQKCVRVRGKHDDIDNIGHSTRHLTFFEMLGNFSFGDYFKEEAIASAWTFLTEQLGLDGDRLWATVHHSDDEAAQIWKDTVGLPDERIQRLGEDNFWEMADTGPCGPSSEIFYDKGASTGHDGGPAHGGEERYVEIWNLVFMQYQRREDQSLDPLSRRNIDTGAGMERILPILQDTSSVFDTDVLRRLIGVAEDLCQTPYGKDAATDVHLRILADHARTMTFLSADGVLPSNHEQGYVLRRIVRRAAMHGTWAGAQDDVLPEMAAAVTDLMGHSYPELRATLGRTQTVLAAEEQRFRSVMTRGENLLDQKLPAGAATVPGALAFSLHDTHGFPIEVTREVAAKRGLTVDDAGFDARMAQQRQRAADAITAKAARNQLAADRPGSRSETRAR